jgi:protein tyrosine phosphatase (PTP) superfamily phosphohydrolase (DUF442 family)
MMVVYTHIPLDRLDMTRDQVEDFVARLNVALDEGPTLVAAREGKHGDIVSAKGRFAHAFITTEDTLAIDARLAERLNLSQEKPTSNNRRKAGNT